MTDTPAPATPAGLLPLRARGNHEIEAAGGWVVACGAYNEYGCMPTEVRNYIVATLNAARTTPAEALDVERLHAARCLRSVHGPVHLPDCDCSDIAAEYARLSPHNEEPDHD